MICYEAYDLNIKGKRSILTLDKKHTNQITALLLKPFAQARKKGQIDWEPKYNDFKEMAMGVRENSLRSNLCPSLY